MCKAIHSRHNSTLLPATEVKAAMGAGYTEPAQLQVPTNQAIGVTQLQSSHNFPDAVSSETPVTNPGSNGSRQSQRLRRQLLHNLLWDISFFEEGVVTRSGRQGRLSVRAEEVDM